MTGKGTHFTSVQHWFGTERFKTNAADDGRASISGPSVLIFQKVRVQSPSTGIRIDGTFLSIRLYWLGGKDASGRPTLNNVKSVAVPLSGGSMQLVSSRIVRFIDSQSLEPGSAREVLFRNSSGFHSLSLG